MGGTDKIRLIGPGGAGKSTIGALLAERLEIAFVDLDQHLAGRVGDISKYIGWHGYDVYAPKNVETYCLLCREETHALRKACERRRALVALFCNQSRYTPQGPPFLLRLFSEATGRPIRTNRR